MAGYLEANHAVGLSVDSGCPELLVPGRNSRHEAVPKRLVLVPCGPLPSPVEVHGQHVRLRARPRGQLCVHACSFRGALALEAIPRSVALEAPTSFSSLRFCPRLPLPLCRG